MNTDDPSTPLTPGNATPAAPEAARETTPGSLAKRLLRAEWGALSTDEREVIEAVLARITSGKVVARDINKELRGVSHLRRSTVRPDRGIRGFVDLHPALPGIPCLLDNTQYQDPRTAA